MGLDWNYFTSELKLNGRSSTVDTYLESKKTYGP